MEKTDDTCPSGAYHRRLDTTPPAVIDGLLKKAGIRINGDAPWDIQVHDPDLYRRVLTHGSLGFGEAYMDGLWDAERLDELLYRLMRENIEDQLTGIAKLRILLEILRVRLVNLQSSKRAFQVGEQHYDTGNDVFEAMLDPTLSYTCGFWQNASTLHEAQLNKLKLICDKLELKPGERLLDIGCGWGGLVKYAAENYGVEAVGITVSREQQQLAQQRMGDLPVSIELVDYRDVTGQFDKLVSVGMFEHVGPKNYAAYFDTAKRIMKEDGLFLLHTIGTYKTAPRTDPWIDKYIFPNGKLPSMKELSIVLEDRFIVEDWHNFGQDYDKTLMTWWDNFNAHWPQLKDKYGERFYRMWKYYLLCCAGFFRSRQGQLWQLVLSNRHRAGQYRSIR